MTATKRYTMLWMLAVLLAGPGLAPAATTKACDASVTANRSFERGAPDEAVALMEEVRTEARQAAMEADGFATAPALSDDSWRLHAERLNRIADSVNHMGQALCRLETLRSSAQPWEQGAIDQAAPVIKLMALHTTEAIDYINAHHIGLWRPEFQKFESTIQTESHGLARLMGDYVTYARSNTAVHRLENKLNLKSTS